MDEKLATSATSQRSVFHAPSLPAATPPRRSGMTVATKKGGLLAWYQAFNFVMAVSYSNSLPATGDPFHDIEQLVQKNSHSSQCEYPDIDLFRGSSAPGIEDVETHPVTGSN